MIWVRQLGWWHSQYMEKMFQTTNQFGKRSTGEDSGSCWQVDPLEFGQRGGRLKQTTLNRRQLHMQVLPPKKWMKQNQEVIKQPPFLTTVVSRIPNHMTPRAKNIPFTVPHVDTTETVSFHQWIIGREHLADVSTHSIWWGGCYARLQKVQHLSWIIKRRWTSMLSNPLESCKPSL